MQRYDLIVVGGGPAGLATAVYAMRKRLHVLLVSQDLGGKINYTMQLAGVPQPQQIRGADLVEEFWQELDNLEFERRLEPVHRVTKEADLFSVHLDNEVVLQARSIVAATGARVQRLDAPGEKRFLGRGVTYSALSHAYLFWEKTAVVVGDGQRARRAVTDLLQVAAQIHLVTPAADAGAVLDNIAESSDKVQLWPGHEIAGITGDEFVTQVQLRDPEGTAVTLPVDGVFVELGLQPNSQPFAGLADVDDRGHLIVTKHNQTTCAGLFAAGDVTDVGLEQVLIAVGEGMKAALAAYDYLLPAF